MHLGVLVGHTEKMAGLMFVDWRGRLIRSLATMPVGACAGGRRSSRIASRKNRLEQPPADEQPAPPGEQPSEEKPPEQPDEPMPEQ